MSLNQRTCPSDPLPYDEETFLDLVDVGQAEAFAESITDGQYGEKKREEAPASMS